MAGVEVAEGRRGDGVGNVEEEEMEGEREVVIVIGR
jgi:hypothetical protein